MSPATCLWIAHAATAGLAFVLIWAFRKMWREAPAEFHATVAELQWGRVLPTLGCFSVGFVTVAFLLVTLPH